MAETSTVGAQEFSVAMGQLEAAIGVASNSRDAIHGDTGRLRTLFTKIESTWLSPSGDTFIDFEVQFNRALDGLDHIVDEIVERMKATHQNYTEAESKNATILG